MEELKNISEEQLLKELERRKNKPKPKKKAEFSKKIFFGISIGMVTLILFTMFMVYKTQNLNPLSYILTGAFGAFTTAIGFYYHKARKENEIKISRGVNLDNDYIDMM
ncbi:hypothetical protein [Dethiothermospora halolimnae]|uniref:hypothetical protein n=1 Tax=Dethiothermospora halolimnae TaxID=3114390 RepID=UPI003CCC000A